MTNRPFHVPPAAAHLPYPRMKQPPPSRPPKDAAVPPRAQQKNVPSARPPFLPLPENIFIRRGLSLHGTDAPPRSEAHGLDAQNIRKGSFHHRRKMPSETVFRAGFCPHDIHGGGASGGRDCSTKRKTPGPFRLRGHRASQGAASLTRRRDNPPFPGAEAYRSATA